MTYGQRVIILDADRRVIATVVGISSAARVQVERAGTAAWTETFTKRRNGEWVRAGEPVATGVKLVLDSGV